MDALPGREIPFDVHASTWMQSEIIFLEKRSYSDHRHAGQSRLTTNQIIYLGEVGDFCDIDITNSKFRSFFLLPTHHRSCSSINTSYIIHTKRGVCIKSPNHIIIDGLPFISSVLMAKIFYFRVLQEWFR